MPIESTITLAPAPQRTPPPLSLKPAPTSPDPSPLSIDQSRQLLLAQERFRKVTKCTGFARFDGWTVGVFGAITLLGGLLGFDLPAILLGAAMCAVAAIEIRGIPALRRLDPSAARRLAFNQFAFAAVLTLYALWQLHAASKPSAELAPYMNDPAVAQVLGSSLQDMSNLISRVLYGTLIAVALVFQGGAGIYYLTRQRKFTDYTASTPQWIVDLQRSGAV